MENRKFKILVLSDLKDSTHSTLKSTIGLAKIIGGDVEFFHVTKPTEVVTSDSQLSAMRNINKQFINTDKKISEILKPLLLDYNVKITSNYTFGNVKNEIQKRIDTYKPDVVVLGRRVPKTINIFGDNITDFILKQFNGVVMIASRNKVLDTESQLSIGAFNNLQSFQKNILVERILDKGNSPLKTFEIEESIPKTDRTNSEYKSNKINYVFEDSPNAIKTLSSYVAKNNINLFCFNRNSPDKVNYTKHLIDCVEVSLLVA